MELFFIKVFVITIASLTSLVNSKCFSQKATDVVDFEVQCSRIDDYNVKIYCHSDDWNKFPNAILDLTSSTDILFNNCSFPASINVQNILHSMKIEVNGRVYFNKLHSIPKRHNFQNLSATKLFFLSSSFNELPSDLLHDVLKVDTLQISSTQLARIPESFFADWAVNILEVNLDNNKLRKISRNDFSRLINVNTIDLSSNDINEIEPNAFDALIKLHHLSLSSNRLLTLPSGIFHQMIKLMKIDLGRNLFQELSRNSFENTKNLVEFYMEKNDGTLRTLPRGFFKNLMYLKIVDLGYSQLENLPPDLFTGCSQLSNLVLSNNRLQNLPTGLFNETVNLVTLKIDSNRLESLEPHIFERLTHLKELYISHNQLTSLTQQVFDGLQSLESFDASHNNISQIDDGFIVSLKSATSINLSYNQLTFEKRSERTSEHSNASSSTKDSKGNSTKIFEMQINPSVKFKRINFRDNKIKEFNSELISMLQYSDSINLRCNRISKINLSDFPLKNNMNNSRGQTKVYLQNNPFECDCKIADFARYLNGWRGNELYNIFDHDEYGEFTCASPLEFAHEELRDLSLEELSCSLKTDEPDDACNKTCVCREYPEKQVLSVDCSYRNLTQLPSTIRNFHKWSIKLNMTGNLLQSTPSLNESYLMNVTSLDISDNNITVVTHDLFSSSLQHLKLHGNSISRLDSNVIDYLANSTLHSITLHGNKWICDCEARDLITFVQKKYMNYGFNEMACYRTNRKLYKMTASELCTDESMIAIIIISSLLIAFLGIVVASLVALYYKYQREIKVWLYSKQLCLWFVTEDELDKDKEYDAFISFSHKDEHFVEKEIVAKLEEGPRPYKLCLHYRDWLAGEWIPVQISRSVEASRRTIVILTPNFLESVWGLLEFRTAHTQALKEGRARLIVIICGDIGNIEDLDQEMQDYLRLNTYIKWGDPWFWNKLKYALPHSKEPTKRKARDVDVLNNIHAKVTSELSINSIPKTETSTNDSINLCNASAEGERLIVSFL